MKIGVIGTGYVGLVAGTCLADLGNEVICLDIDQNKIDRLNEGIIPIYEPGLEDLIKRNVRENRLSFTTDTEKTVRESQVLFIAVGTPSRPDGGVDLSYVKSVAEDIGRHMNEFKVIVDKSTVPVGTHKLVEEHIKASQPTALDFEVVSNPEFLREGEAIKDFMSPDRIIIGMNHSPKAKEIMEEIYKGITRTGKPLVFTSVQSAEMIKYASNAMLATRISFMNELARLCEKVGADVKEVSHGLGLDSRIGPRFLQAGIGYGGSCFPKDIKALISTAREHGVALEILQAVEKVNQTQKKFIVPKIKELVGDLNGRTIALWGLAFKPKTDDMREAPSLVIIEELLAAGAKVKAFDPEAADNSRKILGEKIVFAGTALEAVEGADCLVLVTEWDEFRSPDFDKVKSLMVSANLVDGRNIYDPEDMKKKGFRYLSVGR